MALTRRVANPSKELLRTLLESKVRDMYPLDFQWFSRDELDETGVLGQINKTLVETGLDWVYASEYLKLSNTLETASDVLLDLIGEGYGIYRSPDEDDDDYALRIQEELLIERVTGPAILNGLLKIIPGAKLFEPWRKLAIPSVNWIPSQGWHTPSHDFWRGAVFEVWAFGRSGVDASRLDNFLDAMKAYGVKFWIANFLPIAPIDWHDDPLIQPLVVPLLPSGIPDPRLTARPNLVIGSTTDLITDTLEKQVPDGAILSTKSAKASVNFLPSGGFPRHAFVLDMVGDYLAEQSVDRAYSALLLPAAMLDPLSPNYATIVSDGYTVTEYRPGDLVNNFVMDQDVDATATAGGVPQLRYLRPEMTATGLEFCSWQAACLIQQELA